MYQLGFSIEIPTFFNGIKMNYQDFYSNTIKCINKGVQKTKEPKKPLQTDRTDAKISVQFIFGFIIFKIENFDSVFGGKF